jgi:hypothetical protein
MTRTQVWKLMRDIPEEDSCMGNSLDHWDIGGRYTLLVEFGPDYDVEPGTVDQRDPEGDNWTVKQVTLLDLSKPTPLQHLLAWLGLWSRSPGLTKRCT